MPRKLVLTDQQIVDLLTQQADKLRQYRGETAEGEAALRTVEYLTRTTDERLFVYLHVRDHCSPDLISYVKKRN